MEKVKLMLEEIEKMMDEKRDVGYELVKKYPELSEWNIGYADGLENAKEIIVNILEIE